MPLDPHLVDEAERRGYLGFNEDRSRITYYCAREYQDNYGDAEEAVRALVFSWLILDRGYPANRIRIEYAVPRRVPGDMADIVVFEDDALSHPYLVVEAKRSGAPTVQWLQAIEQGFGNANSLRTTQYLLVDCDDRSILFDIQNHPATERDQNRLGDRVALGVNYGIVRQFRLVAGGDEDIRAMDPSSVESIIRRAHAAIWAGGRRDPLAAFDEWSKLLFGKIWDERHTPNGVAREFQRAAAETVPQTANRVRERFREARRGDRSIFPNDAIELPDDKVVEVVEIIQELGFTLCNIDTLGHAFESFFGSVFRGDLGQYFTRRELVRFVCAALELRETDFVLDPTAGSGGFLLEALMQVWHYVDDNYAGQPDLERRKADFALGHVFGIEINAALSRLCKVNLLIHKDGHTNIDAERSCLDSIFSLPNLRPDSSVFTAVVGNPPFGDAVKRGDTDRLGRGDLDDFQLSSGRAQIPSELVIIERSLQFLVPGGRLGMVVPDGVLNNSGENSYCPAFRRMLFANARLDMVVSLPDHAFRKAGAQNKTSLLFVTKYTAAEKAAYVAAYNNHIQHHFPGGLTTIAEDFEAIAGALDERQHLVFLAEVENIGYTPAGNPSENNNLYSLDTGGHPDVANMQTLLGEYAQFKSDRVAYAPVSDLSILVMAAGDLVRAHSSARLDPKFHIFRANELRAAPTGLIEYQLRQLLTPRSIPIRPALSPDTEYLTLTLHQDGTVTQREAGVGNNPPSYHGVYFAQAAEWNQVRAGDLLISRIDLWKGCVSVVAGEYDGAIVTNEFPAYYVDASLIDPHFLALILRSRYFRRAIRAITTGHSNRRRVQEADLFALSVFLPDLPTQQLLSDMFGSASDQIAEQIRVRGTILALLDDVIEGMQSVETVRHFTPGVYRAVDLADDAILGERTPPQED